MTGERLRYLCDRLQPFGGASVFAEMSALAVRTGAINLGQGFPDTNGPTEVAAAAIEAIRGTSTSTRPASGIQCCGRRWQSTRSGSGAWSSIPTTKC